MPKVTFILDDVSTTIDADLGSSMMRTAIQHDVEGILGECGGNAMCATCHVYVEDGPVGALPAISPVEQELLDCTAAPRTAASRLSCQLDIVDGIEGLVVRIAGEQV